MSLVAPPVAWGQPSVFVPPAPGTPVAPIEIPAHIAPAPAESAPADRGDKPVARRVISTTTAKIDYRIDIVGPSGVAKVEIYMTTDRGVSWIKLGEDRDRKSSVTVTLPGEGLYGIRLAITNGNGFGGRAPSAGDRPQLYVEVDASSPNVVLRQPTIVASVGAIDIHWIANDANLTAEPASLFYRTRPDSNWQPIANNVKNSGVYRWAFPHDATGPFDFKLEVTDLAGNKTKVETPMPVVLDRIVPEVTLVSASPRAEGQKHAATPAPKEAAPTPPAALSPATATGAMQLPATVPPASVPATIPSSQTPTRAGTSSPD
jgi:hypothetical protein